MTLYRKTGILPAIVQWPDGVGILPIQVQWLEMTLPLLLEPTFQ